MRRLLAMTLAIVCCATPATATDWPHRAKAAVALTYDDALASQLDHAAPALDRAGLKGTFFLSNVKRDHVPRWRALARRGHELANHSLFHPCPAATYPADPRYTSEAYAPAQMIREIEQQEVLLTAIDGRPAHGFASPCTINQVNGQDYIEPLRAAKVVAYARSLDEDDGARHAARFDPMYLAGRSFPATVTGDDLIAYARQAERSGTIAIYVFHGVGGDYLPTSLDAHTALLAWLKAHRRDIWVAPLGEIVAWAQRHPQ